MYGFYKTHNDVLNFDIDKEIDEIRLNHWISRKENISRNRGEFKKGTFGMTVRMIEKDLSITFSKARRMIKRFEEMGIIKLLKVSKSRTEPSIYAYLTVYLEGEKSESVNDTVNDTVKVSDCNASTVTSESVSESVNDTSKKEKEKENKKEKDIKKEKVTNLDKMVLAYTQNNNLVEALKNFMIMRKAVKKPLTDNALKLILNKLDKFGKSDEDKIEMLENSIERCWLSVFELKNKKPSAGTEGNSKTNYNPSICNNSKRNTQKVEVNKFI